MGWLLAVLGLAVTSHAGDCGAADSLRIRNIRLEGLSTTRREVVLRELRHGPGGSFSCSTWAREKTRLEDLDIFADISVQPVLGAGSPARDTAAPIDPVGAGEAADSAGGAPGVDLVYTFRELPPYIPFVAMNKTEQDGLSLGPALASLNFLGRDIRVEILSRFGGTTEFQASASSPWLGKWPWEYDLAALRVDSYNRFEAFREDSWRFKLDLAQRLYALGLGGRAQVLYAGELLVMRSDRPGILLNPDAAGADLVPRLGAGLLWDGRDRRRIPTRGWYQEIRLTQSGGPLGGRADFLEWLADTRIYLPWMGGVLQLGGLYQYRTGTLGNTLGVYDRFHVGGINTLRGYGNDAYRGKSEWLATLENRFDLLGKQTFRLWRWSGYYGVQGVLGVEAASLWDHHAPLERDYHAGMYAGMHLLIAGVDRIRLEAGSKSAKFELKFDIGILDKADIQRFRAR